jgi:hypothetical protein
MIKIWCSISSHGYGHAAQVIPILNELGRDIPGLEVILRTTVPSQFFEHKLQVHWTLQEAPQDIGCVQQGPLDIDVDGTWEAYRQLHQRWTDLVRQEAEAIRSNKIDLVLANISHVGISAGIQAKHPTVAVASLSWDQILLNLAPIRMDWQRNLLAEIQAAYAQASYLIRLFPGIEMPAFSRSYTVGPSCLVLPSTTSNLRKILPVRSGDAIVLVAFGGVPFESFPLEKLEELLGFHFILSGIRVASSFTRISSWDALNLPFLEVFRQADVIMTKPGYATMVAAVQYQIPLVYVRRENFLEESNLVTYARNYGRAFELSRREFESGEWGQVLRTVLGMTRSTMTPPKDGAREAADILKTFLRFPK